jgi:hypothetical protein
MVARANISIGQKAVLRAKETNQVMLLKSPKLRALALPSEHWQARQTAGWVWEPESARQPALLPDWLACYFLAVQTRF